MRQGRSYTTFGPKIGNYFNRLFNIPKGFKKFYPKNGQAADASEGSTVGNASKVNKSNIGGGGGGGAKKGGANNKKQPEMGVGGWATIAALGLAPVLYAMSESTAGRKEISYHEFHNQLLPSGQVERIVIMDKATARVELRANSSSAAATGGSLGGNLTGIADTGMGNGDFSHASADGSVPNDSGFKPDTGMTEYKLPVGTVGVQAEPIAYYINIGSVDSFERKLSESQTFYGISPKNATPVIYTETPNYGNMVYKAGMTILIVGSIAFTMSLMKGGAGGLGGGMGGMMNVGKSKAKKITKEMVNVTFKDVAGCEPAKKEIMEFVEFLRNHAKFTALGAKIPKGALISGPPGTGKTLLAKATAGEANVPFYSISGSDFVEMFVGVGPSRVRDLFKEARANAPCIIFIDEIDAVGRKRGGGRAQGGGDERENTLNQLLVEMDGFESTDGIIVLAGTNRSDVLDPALLRPGRFDRKIQVDNPDIQGRKSIFEIYLKKIAIGDADIASLAARLAALTPGFAGADISNICNEAAILAARHDKKVVDMSDFEGATDRVIGGLETNKLISPEEKRTVAYHEAGHAVAGWNLQYADPLLKVTIIPRGNGALGFAQYLPKEVFLRTKDQLMDTVCMALAGRAAEQVFFGKVTTGASDDLRRVTQIVYQMVQVFGMNERIGQISFPKEDTGGFPADRPYGNATAEAMDEEVRRCVEEAYERTLALISDKKEQVGKVAELLLAKETITHVDVAGVIGKRPYATDKEYEEFAGMDWGKPLKAVEKEEEVAETEKVVTDDQPSPAMA
jgi:AFG3 family protein